MIGISFSIVVLLLLSAFFSASETALTAVSRPMMHELEKRGDRRAPTVNRLLRRRERLLGTILLGNNLVNILASALATSFLIDWLGDETGVVYATVGMTVLVLLFGEILPKTIALTHAAGLALILAPPLNALVWLLTPVTALLQGATRLALKAQPSGAAHYDTAMAELRGVIDLHTRVREDVPEDVRNERAMLRSLLDLGEVKVSEIMVHRRNLLTIDADLPAPEIVEKALAAPYTRIPLWRETPDNIVAVLHVKALFRAVAARRGAVETLNVLEVAAQPWFIPETTTATDQLQAFRARREHFALVVDEYGGLLGIVTLEDVLEEIVGDITDEHDVSVPGVRPQADGSFVVAGDVTLRDLNREFGWELPDDKAATIAGLLLHESRSIPDAGQIFCFHDFRFEVMRRQRNQITAIRVTPQAKP